MSGTRHKRNHLYANAKVCVCGEVYPCRVVREQLNRLHDALGAVWDINGQHEYLFTDQTDMIILAINQVITKIGAGE